MLLIIATLVIVGFNMWRGHSKGLVHIVLSLGSTLAAVIIAAMLAGPVNDYIADNTGIYTAIEKQTGKLLDKEEGDNKHALQTPVSGDENAFKNSARQVMNSLGVPVSVQDTLLGVDIAELAKDGVRTAQDLVIKAVTKCVGVAIIFILLFVIMKIVLAIVIRAMDLLNKLPIIGDINQFAGMIAGAVYGIVIVWLALVVVNMFANMEWAQTVLNGVNGNPVAEFIYNSNIILNMITK